MKLQHWLLFLIGALVLGQVQSACKTHDAEWSRSSTGPRLSQPDRSDPTKVLVSWSNQIENERCVDEYVVLAWKVGQTREHANKLVIKNHATTTAIMNISACVEYHFEVELLENDWTHTDRRSSKISRYQSQAEPQIMDRNPRNFIVSYKYDPVRKLSDLSQVSVKFNKDILKHPDCVKHIELQGVEQSKRPPTMSHFGSNLHLESTRSSSYSFREAPPTTGGGRPGQNDWWNQPGGTGEYPGHWDRPGGSGSYPGHNHDHGHWDHPGGSGSFDGNVVGGHGSFPGGSNRPGSTDRPGTDRPSYGSDQRPPTGGSDRPYYYGNNRNRRELRGQVRGRPSNTGGSGGTHGVGSTISGLATPPFLHEMIEVSATIKPCYPYKLSLKIVNPRGSVMSEIKDLELPQLSEVSSYKPPSLAKLFKVQRPTTTTSGRVSIELQPNYGVPETCLEDFFYAVDKHIELLEHDRNHHMAQEMRGIAYGQSLKDQMRAQQANELARYGCVCNSTKVRVNTTDASLFERFKEAYGIYKYEGMQNGKPFYVRIDNSSMATLDRPTLNGNNRPSLGQYRTNGLSTTTTTPSPTAREAAPSKEIRFHLYWDNVEQAWTVGKTMDGRRAYFMTKKKNGANCPADPQTVRKWQYSGTFAWKDDDGMDVGCMRY